MREPTSMSPEIAHERCAAWEEMHRVYFPDYDARWERLISRAHSARVPSRRPRILDLGCGPGTLTRRLAEQMPHAAVIGIDADPVLIALARAATTGDAAVIFHQTTAGTHTAHALLQQFGPFEIIVSSAFMHYFDAHNLTALHEELRSMLVPDGVLITAESFADRPGKAGATSGDPWGTWWAETHTILNSSERGVVEAPPPESDSRHEPPPLTLTTYVEAAEEAGLFLEAIEHDDSSSIVLLSHRA